MFGSYIIYAMREERKKGERKMKTLTEQERKEMEFEDLPDDKNPAYLFQTTDTSILLAIAQDRIDPVELAKKELASRGLGSNGQWIGFKKAKALWDVLFYRNGKAITIPGD